MTSDPVELSWMAGLFDGEGMASFYRHKSGTGYQYQIVVQLSMIHAPTISRFHSLAGLGSVRCCNQRRGNRRYFVWRASSKSAREFLLAIMAFSTTKREEIRMCLAADSLRDRVLGRGRGRVATADCSALDGMVGAISTMKLVEFTNHKEMV